MPADPKTQDALIRRLEDLAQSIAGPGMGTTMKYRDLRGVLDIVHDARAEAAQLRKAAARSARTAPKSTARGRGKNAPVSGDPCAELIELVPVLADLVEVKAELWGQPLVPAIEAWYAQQGETAPTDLIAAITAALPAPA